MQKTFESLKDNDIEIIVIAYLLKHPDLIDTHFEFLDNSLFSNPENLKIFNVLDESNKYKFIHIDVDLYQPTLDTLEYFYDKVVKGGIIITDDYEAPLFPGNKKAWQKFMYAKDLSYFVLPSGQAVIIKE
jgi:hypothetical protein